MFGEFPNLCRGRSAAEFGILDVWIILGEKGNPNLELWRMAAGAQLLGLVEFVERGNTAFVESVKKHKNL